MIMARRAAVMFLFALLAAIAAAEAQQRQSPALGPAMTPEEAAEDGYDGGFRFCRIRFNTSPAGDGDGWYVDTPGADINLSIRLSELTKIPVTTVGEDEPVHIVVRLTQPELFQCPFVMMTEPGGAIFNTQEAAQLRTYLLKGGFLWADDFWGTRAWQWWSMQIGQALPPDEYPIVDVPLDHPMFHTLFDIPSIPQIPNVGLWINAHRTSERGADSAVPHARAIFDKHGRLMVFMTHNTDFGDAFEQEHADSDYFQRFSIPAYQIAADVMLYSMTH